MNPETKLLLLQTGTAVFVTLAALLTPRARKFLEKILPQSNWWGTICVALLLCAAICGALIQFVPPPSQNRPPGIELTNLPPSPPWPDRFATIAGRVTGAFDPATMRVVVYAHAANQWYVQPTVAEPFTTIAPDGSWSTTTHDGLSYAALLVKAGHHPASPCLVLPQVGDAILASTH